MDVIIVILMLISCHLTLVEVDLERVCHCIKHDTPIPYKMPTPVVVCIWLHIAAIIGYIVKICLK